MGEEFWLGPADRLGGLVVVVPARRAGDPGSIPGPGENFSLKLLIFYIKDEVSEVNKTVWKGMGIRDLFI